VIARDNKQGDKYLCAYLVMVNYEKEYEVSKIAEFLNIHIPEYILPSHYMKIKEIPLTPNGKIDRKKLPDPGGAARIVGDYVAPRNELEEKMAEIWKKELNLEQVGINDNYFTIGGDSIKSIRLISIINRELNKNLKIAELYVNNTIEQLAAVISKPETDVSTADAQYEKAQYEKALEKVADIKNKFLQGVQNK
jgi:fengycin family lipopeptide synthetase D